MPCLSARLLQGFGPDIKQLLGPILFSPERRAEVQFVLATATLTPAVRRLLEEGDLPPCRLLETSDLGQVGCLNRGQRGS